MNIKINAKQDMSPEDYLLMKLRQDKETRKIRFSIPRASKVFEEYYKRQVYLNGSKYIPSPELSKCLLRIGEWLENPNATTGLMLAGIPGNGKTTALSAISKMISLCGQLDMEQEDSNGEHKACHLFSYKATDLLGQFTNRKEFLKAKNNTLLAIDDFGCEPTDVSVFGNIYNPINSLLDYRYSNKKLTILTTNLKIVQIKRRYGVRIADRFNEMMTIIAFPKQISYRRLDAINRTAALV